MKQIDVQLLCTDSLKYMKKISRSKIPFIDAVITDPPYNISRTNNFKTINRHGIFFGSWDVNFSQTKWISLVSPLIKKGGSIIIFNDYKNFGAICKALEKNGFLIKDIIRWIKNNPMPRNVDRRYVTDYEFAVWATKEGCKWTFNKNPETHYLRPEFEVPIVPAFSEKIHPTQKPVKLMESIIKIHTNKDDTIFDPFMGSGSTGIAAYNTGRKFIGCEIEQKYFERTVARFDELKIITKQNLDINFIRSPLFYLGDKFTLLSQLIPLMPKKINTFFDIFGGGGTMLSNINADNYIYNDIDKNIFLILKLFFETPIEKIIYSLYKHISTDLELKNDINTRKAAYNKLKNIYNSSNDKDSYNSLIILLVLIFYGFNNQVRFNSQGNFNIPIGKQHFNKTRETILINFIHNIQNKKIKFFNKDFSFVEELLKANNINEGDFFYFDPPYLISDATYNKNWSLDDDFRLMKLLDKLNELNIKWGLSNLFYSKGISNDNLINWARKYKVFFLSKSYKNSNYQRDKLNKDEEVYITNYENKRI